MLAIQNENEEFVFSQTNVAKVAVQFFEKTLGDSSIEEPCLLPDFDCCTLSLTQAESLVEPVTDEIIYNTLKKMKRNKAPGPDGFTMEFFTATWDTVGELFCDAVKYFFNSSQMHQGINSTCIALIPKVHTPTSMKDYRRISLCTIVYKCIAKNPGWSSYKSYAKFD